MKKLERRKGEEGVALIVVLGFLSLMLVMAVAFLRTAVTEDLVSDYSQEAIRSRQVLRSGLYAAMNDYSRELWSEKLYLPDEDYQIFTSEANGIDAVPGTAATLRGSQITLLRGEALDWIPARYRTEAMTNQVDRAEWVLVREDPGTRSRILGRYAYVCFDCSGALDANFIALDDNVGKGDSRAMTNRTRRSIRDVPMGLLPELADAGQFKSYRRGWKGFDSPQMLVKLTDGKANDGNGQATRWQTDRKETHGAGLTSNLVSELTSYSLSAYRGGRYSRSSGKWTKPKYLQREKWVTTSGWKEALSPIYPQFTQVDDMGILNMMKDFTTKQVWPEGVEYPSVKNVPMFNEVIVRNLHLNEPTKNKDDEWEYTAKVEIQFEFWYPFPSGDNKISSEFELEAPSLSMGSYPGKANFAMPVALVTSGGTPITVEGTVEASPTKINVEAKWNNGKPYVIAAFTNTVKFKPLSTDHFPSGDCKLMWRQGWETKEALDLKYDGHAVDRLPSGLASRISGTVLVEPGKTHDKRYVKEAMDPRINHLTGDWQDATDDDGTPDEINACTMNNVDFAPEGRAMYCRNAPFDSPADFGFFPTGSPWKTIDLLTEQGMEFLALTTMDEDIQDAIEKKGVFYTNAQLNINTRCTNALASAFYELSTVEVPRWTNSIPTNNLFKTQFPFTKQLDEDMARSVAGLITNVTGVAPYQSGMDWAANAELMGEKGWLAAQGLNRNQREQMLRNTYGLFSVADSLFLVVVVAQSVKEGPESSKVGEWDDEDQITGERRGVALVWRDPFRTGTNPHHEMMVRMFRYLND